MRIKSQQPEFRLSNNLFVKLVLYQLLFACNNEIIRTLLWLEQLTWCVQ